MGGPSQHNAQFLLQRALIVIQVADRGLGHLRSRRATEVPRQLMPEKGFESLMYAFMKRAFDRAFINCSKVSASTP
jgi:hypothetical protein